MEMPTNKRTKYRGSRTCGGGTHKNRRGAGNRGGRGRAGQQQGRYTHFLLLGELAYGKHGFVRKQTAPNRVLDVGQLDEMADDLVDRGLASREGDAVVIDADQIGIDKILGGGKVTQKMNISARAFSENARTKIEEKGGQIEIV
jgi:large subunit ribosomal protein L15